MAMHVIYAHCITACLGEQVTIQYGVKSGVKPGKFDTENKTLENSEWNKLNQIIRSGLTKWSLQKVELQYVTLATATKAKL